LQEELGELTQAYLQHTGRARAKGLTAEEIRAGFHQEFADVFCQLLLFARQYDVDLTGEIERKWLAREG
jgi:NTP pyrophosphatase (non-canonical NTP hydrolase)